MQSRAASLKNLWGRIRKQAFWYEDPDENGDDYSIEDNRYEPRQEDWDYSHTSRDLFWSKQFFLLDKRYPRYDPRQGRYVNQIKNHYRAFGLTERPASSIAFWYNGYRLGEHLGRPLTKDQAIDNLLNELPAIDHLIGNI